LQKEIFISPIVANEREARDFGWTAISISNSSVGRKVSCIVNEE